MLALLAAEPLLEAAFMRHETSRLLLVVLAYVWIINGLFWVGMPWIMRDQIAWLTAKMRRYQTAAWAGVLYSSASDLLRAFSFGTKQPLAESLRVRRRSAVSRGACPQNTSSCDKAPNQGHALTSSRRAYELSKRRECGDRNLHNLSRKILRSIRRLSREGVTRLAKVLVEGRIHLVGEILDRHLVFGRANVEDLVGRRRRPDFQ